MISFTWQAGRWARCLKRWILLVVWPSFCSASKYKNILLCTSRYGQQPKQVSVHQGNLRWLIDLITFPRYLLWRERQQYSPKFDTVSKQFRKPINWSQSKSFEALQKERKKQTTKYCKAFGNSPEPWTLWDQFSWRSPLSWKYPDNESWRSNVPVRSIVLA